MPIDPQPGRTNILQLVIGLVFLVPPALYALYVAGLAVPDLTNRQNAEMAVAVILLVLMMLGAPIAIGAWLTYSAFPRRASFPKAAAEGPPRWSPLRIVMFTFGLLWLVPAACRLAATPFMSTTGSLLYSPVSNAVTMALGGALMYAALKLRRRA